MRSATAGTGQRQPGGGTAIQAPLWRSFCIGLVLLGLGAATMGLVLYLGDTAEPAAEHLYFALGLTGMAILSLAGQVMGTIGLVYLWRWWRRTTD